MSTIIKQLFRKLYLIGILNGNTATLIYSRQKRQFTGIDQNVEGAICQF